MTDVTQIVLVSVITILTVVVSLVGIQAFFLIKESRVTVRKMNEVLDDTRTITSKLASSTESVSGAMTGISAALSIFGALKNGALKKGK